jgi:hypothetical protein
MVYRRAGLLCFLIFINIAVPALVFSGGTLAAPMVLKAGWVLAYNLLFAYVPLATLLLAGDAVLLLGLWTALDPARRPILRWLTIASVLALAAAAGSGCVYVQELVWSWQGRSFDNVLVGYWSITFAAGLFTSALIGTLAIHALIWPLRMAFGWRIIWRDQSIPSPDRKFSLAEGMIWICWISILLAFLKSYFAVDWFNSTIVMGVASILAAAFIVVPALWVTIAGRPTFWKPAAFGAWLIAIVSGQIHLLLLNRPTPALTWVDIAPYVLGVNLVATGTVITTLVILKRAGAQLVSVPLKAPNVAPVANP